MKLSSLLASVFIAGSVLTTNIACAGAALFAPIASPAKLASITGTTPSDASLFVAAATAEPGEATRVSATFAARTVSVADWATQPFLVL